MKLRIALAILCLAAVTASAQTFRGGIQGNVSDETGAALPGVTITATSVGTGLARTAVTDGSGNYFFSELPLGEYSVAASLTGFKTSTTKGVRVEAAASQRVNVQLSTGDLKESIEVVARTP
ncbi:MAG: carboxypeptidase-like regulatory domain-containing protein, partial [Vicinamibacteria bacterium]